MKYVYDEMAPLQHHKWTAYRAECPRIEETNISRLNQIVVAYV